MGKFVHKCECGGTISAVKMAGREYVNRADVYEVPSTLVIDTCDRCKDMWFYLSSKKMLTEIMSKKPIRTMSKEEHDEYWDDFLVKRGSTSLYRKGKV